MRPACSMLVAVFAITLVPAGADAKKGKGAKDHSRGQAYSGAQPATEGKAARLMVNPFGEVDGVMLEGGTLVTFPAHMGDRLAATVRPGDSVVVHGYPESPSQIKGYVITNPSSGRSVMTMPKPRNGIKMPKFMRRMGLKSMNATGEVRHLRYDKKGEINGVVLSDGTVVRFARDALHRFGGLLEPGRHIAASGYGSENRHGRALEATALGVEGRPPQPLYPR